MASTFKAVRETMEDMNISTYNVKSRRGALLGYNHDSKLSVDAAISKIEKLLCETSGDFVTIEINPKMNGKGGDTFKIIKMEVDLNSVRPQTIAGAGPDISFNRYIDQLKAKDAELMELRTALIKAEHKKEIDDLKTEIAGIKENDTIGKLVESLAPLLIAYIPKLINPGAPPPAINGIANISEREDLLNRWAASDPAYMQLLIAIVMIAESDPANYNQYKPIIISANKHN
jgi:hypothetical protein